MCKQIFDIINVSESWLHNEILDAKVSHPDYILYRKDRIPDNKKCRGGGVLCNIKKSVMTLCREDLEPPEGEIMVIEIRPNRCKKSP